jgi:predicted esterase
VIAQLKSYAERQVRQMQVKPVFIGHGKDDRSVDYKAAKKANKTLKKLGYDVTLFTFDGGKTRCLVSLK